MPSFLNINLDGKIETNFFIKHLFFNFFWVLGILIFVFRIDILLAQKYTYATTWLPLSIPSIYFLSLVIYFFFIRWYYIIAFFFYPFLMFFWFIPKTILSVGKVYLLGTYLNWIFSKLSNIKLFAFNVFFLIFSFIFLITINENWTRWLCLICLSYFYLIYLYKFLIKSFKQPTLFGAEIDEVFEKLIDDKSAENSLVIKSYIIQKEDDKIDQYLLKEVRIKRMIMANYAIELLSKRLNGYRGRQAYLISWIFGAFMFLLSSIIFFWFINFQLYKIDSTNFQYIGTFPSFDFLYYTLKTITFGDIELVKPSSVLSRISEISSFFTIGIFMLVIVISIFLSMKQDKVNENVKLTTELMNSESLTLVKYMQDEFGMEIKTAFNEIKNIDDSIKKLKDIIDKIF